MANCISSPPTSGETIVGGGFTSIYGYGKFNSTQYSESMFSSESISKTKTFGSFSSGNYKLFTQNFQSSQSGGFSKKMYGTGIATYAEDSAK